MPTLYRSDTDPIRTLYRPIWTSYGFYSGVVVCHGARASVSMQHSPGARPHANMKICGEIMFAATRQTVSFSGTHIANLFFFLGLPFTCWHAGRRVGGPWKISCVLPGAAHPNFKKRYNDVYGAGTDPIRNVTDPIRVRDGPDTERYRPDTGPIRTVYGPNIFSYY